MTQSFSHAIAAALGRAPSPQPALQITGTDRLPSVFDLAGLASASVAAAAAEAGALMGAANIQIDARLCQLWFTRSIQPQGWEMPNPWDVIAGDYRTDDGWIKLHTNAPLHRAAALAVLGCDATRDDVAQAVSAWHGNDLEDAIVAGGGCAAALRAASDWSTHPQGQAVMAEPLIQWTKLGPMRRSPPPLDGLRVLDLTRVLAGPVATRFLAQMGADVLRIDPPTWSEPGVVPDVTLGKRCTGLDLGIPEDRKTFESLLARADVLVHGYRKGALDALGYDEQTRQTLSGGHVDVSLNAYGHTGPWANRRGFDSLVQMSSGIAHAGDATAGDGCPVPLPVQALDHATGYLMAAAVLRAVRLAKADGHARAARLSLARTAALLMSAPHVHKACDMLPMTAGDLDPWLEATPWGPAHRVRFPATFDGLPPPWPSPAVDLRSAPPCW